MSLPTSQDEILLLHNPKCSKSRATLALLEERGVAFTTRRYLEEPLDAGELRELARRLDRPVIAFMRTKQAEFAEAGLSDSSPEPVLIEAICAAPILLERPVVVRGDRAEIGRPPEAVLGLLED